MAEVDVVNSTVLSLRFSYWKGASLSFSGRATLNIERNGCLMQRIMLEEMTEPAPFSDTSFR